MSKPDTDHQPVAIPPRLLQPDPMTEPLALVVYEKLLPGSQIVNRLQDLNYRVQTISDPALLAECAEQGKIRRAGRGHHHDHGSADSPTKYPNS